MTPDEARALARRLRAGERDAVAPALNLVDDRRPARRDAALALLAELENDPGTGARRVGLTGAPGAGKSTLLDAVIRALRARDESVGILAVDPSSQRSGGALLGDRFRVRAGARDPGVFLRSMAARDRLGGLAEATPASVSILGAVFDTVFIETVGVGQSESDVAHLVDTLVFVAQPAAGDSLQYMKAGLVELPDLFVVNKADLGAAAERTAAEIGAGLGLAEARSDGWRPPVLQVSAREGRGIEALLDALGAHRRHLEEARPGAALLRERRRRGERAFVRDALRERYGRYGVECLGGEAVLEARLADEEEAPAAALRSALSAEIEDALRKPR